MSEQPRHSEQPPVSCWDTCPECQRRVRGMTQTALQEAAHDHADYHRWVRLTAPRVN